MAGEQTLGGGTNSRPLNDTVAETGPGIPDESVNPEQRTVPEQMELADGASGEAMARKLEQDAETWRGGDADDDEATADPTGHA